MKAAPFLIIFLPALALATGTTTDQITMKPQASPSCTSGRACIYGKSGTDRVYIVDSAGLELQSNAARSFRTSADCSALSSPANGDVCYDTTLPAFRLYSAGWTTVPVNDSLLVHKAGSETITGNKIFSGTVTLSGVATGSALVVARTSGGGSGALGAATKYLTAPGQAASASEVYLSIATRASVIHNLYCYLSTAPGGSDTVIITARIAGSDSALTCTISAAGQTCNDTSNSAAVVAGNGLSVKEVSSAGTAAGLVCSFEETAS